MKDYCNDFIKRNLDGVLNLGQKSVMNQYLNDMLADSMHQPGKQYRDDFHHPLNKDILMAGSLGRPTFHREWLANGQDWIRACYYLSESPIVKRNMALAASREQQVSTQTAHRARRSSSVCTDPTATTGRRSRESSCSSEKEARKSCSQSSILQRNVSEEDRLDHCIKSTTNMDLSTSQAAMDKSEWLSKEIRGVRKKLNQIEKLQLSLSQDKSLVLSAEQLAKLDRRPLLESELQIFDKALEEVKERLKHLRLEEQKEAADVDCGSEKKLEDKNTCSSSDEKEKGCFLCSVCKVKCPDQKSLELHRNGRKHRNRVSQVAQEEQKEAAASIREKHHLEQVKLAAMQPPTVSGRTHDPKNAWNTGSVQPKYKLPPPPHRIVAQVPPVPAPTAVGQSSPPKIANKEPSLHTTTKPLPQTPAMAFHQILKEEAEKSKPRVTPSSAGRSPVWSSSPNSTRCLPMNLFSGSPPSDPSLPSGGSNGVVLNLGDLLVPSHGPSSDTRVKTTPAPWLCPVSPKSGSGAKNLKAIQMEEAEFKKRQASTVGVEGGSWFIEQRERAGSFLAIQESAEKERENRLFIEEQIWIEEQIKKENASRLDETKVSRKKKRGSKKGSKEGKTKAVRAVNTETRKEKINLKAGCDGRKC